MPSIKKGEEGVPTSVKGNRIRAVKRGLGGSEHSRGEGVAKKETQRPLTSQSQRKSKTRKKVVLERMGGGTPHVGRDRLKKTQKKLKRKMGGKL